MEIKTGLGKILTLPDDSATVKAIKDYNITFSFELPPIPYKPVAITAKPFDDEELAITILIQNGLERLIEGIGEVVGEVVEQEEV